MDSVSNHFIVVSCFVPKATNILLFYMPKDMYCWVFSLVQSAGIILCADFYVEWILNVTVLLQVRRASRLPPLIALPRVLKLLMSLTRQRPLG